MAWAFVAIGAVGLALGCRFRVPALLAVSVALVGIMLAIGLVADWSLMDALASSLAGLATLQFGYLIGLFAAMAWHRRRPRPCGLYLRA